MTDQTNEQTICNKCNVVVVAVSGLKPLFCSNCGTSLTNDNEENIPGARWGSVFNPIKGIVQQLEGHAKEVTTWTKAQFNSLTESWEARVDRTVNQAMANGQTAEAPVQTSRDPKESFKATLRNSIQLKFAEALKAKPPGETYLTFFDGEYLSSEVRNFYLNVVKVVPADVERALSISLLFLSPNQQRREQTIRTLLSASGGAAGVGLLIGAVGSALGWGAGLIAAIGTAITGASLLGPIAIGALGALVTVLAVYFGTTSNQAADSERFMRAFEASNLAAVDNIWDVFGERLSATVSQPHA